MAQPLLLPPSGFDDLPVEEKLDYVQSLWDRIAAHPEQVAVPEWHKRVVNQRLAAYRANPQDAQPWDQVRSELLQKLRGG